MGRTAGLKFEPGGGKDQSIDLGNIFEFGAVRVYGCFGSLHKSVGEVGVNAFGVNAFGVNAFGGGGVAGDTWEEEEEDGGDGRVYECWFGKSNQNVGSVFCVECEVAVSEFGGGVVGDTGEDGGGGGGWVQIADWE